MNSKKLIKMPSIEQFRSVVSNINRHYNFVGLDENGEPMYDVTKPKPTITFKGTCKLHGSNSAVSYNNLGGFWCQSKNDIITPQKDNMGFAFFAESKKESFLKLINLVAKDNNIDLDKNTITIYGEWVGKGIQKGVGIANLDKSMFIFGVKISPIVDNTDEVAVKNNPAYWVDCSYLSSKEDNIYNVYDYKTFEIEVDFNMPQLIQNDIVDMTLSVEENCPVAAAFGFSNTIGEGIVFSADVNGIKYSFKSKGVKHAGSSKVRTIASVDTEKLNSIQEFIEYAVTEGRFNQALENVFPNNEPVDVKKMGEIIRWVINDIIKEEMDTMTDNNIEPSDVNKYISTKVREMFFKMA